MPGSRKGRTYKKLDAVPRAPGEELVRMQLLVPESYREKLLEWYGEYSGGVRKLIEAEHRRREDAADARARHRPLPK